MTEEIWKQSVNFVPRIQVSNLGNTYNEDTGKHVSMVKNKHGIIKTRNITGKIFRKDLAVILYETFFETLLEGQKIWYKDGDFTNLKIDNLIKVTDEDYGDLLTKKLLSNQEPTECLPKEEWKQIVGLEEFGWVSNLGRVHSRSRYTKNGVLSKGKFKEGTDNGLGYLQVKFEKEGIVRRKYIHVMVAEAFIPKPISEEDLEVNHIDGDKSNNTQENLEWLTHSENLKHAVDSGLFTYNEHVLTCSFCKKAFKSTRKRDCFCSKLCKNNYNKVKEIKKEGNNTSHIPISKEELQELLYETNFEAVGRKFNKSGTAVRKWCKNYGIPHHSSFYKK